MRILHAKAPRTTQTATRQSRSTRLKTLRRLLLRHAVVFDNLADTSGEVLPQQPRRRPAPTFPDIYIAAYASWP